jgi:NAD(P)H-flavin reductase
MNPLKPLKARITDIRSEVAEVRTYAFSVDSVFSARPGQFNMVGYPGVGEAPVSFSSVPHNGSFEHTIKAVGRVTGFLSGFKKGDELFLRGPYGKGWPMKNAEGKDIILIAGGVGLAPMRPVVQRILEERELFGDVNLIYGARNEQNLLFMHEFGAWGKSISLHLAVDEVSQHPPVSNRDGKGIKGGRKYHVGLVTDLLEKVKPGPDTLAFVCGPEIMMRFVCRGLVMQGVPNSKIYVSIERRMKCGIAHCGHCQYFGLFVCKDGPVFSYDEIRGLPDGLL